MSRYGHAHRRLRERWRPRVEAEAVCCARCGVLILAGEAWDLGHDAADAERYDGPMHAACNRNTATEKRLRGRGRGRTRWVNPAW